MYKIINEVLRKELIKGSKLQSPDRLARSKKYSAKDFKNVNFRQLMEHDTFTWIARVGDHTVAISFEGPFEDLKFYVKGMRGPNRLKRINVKLVAAALSKSLDENDLYISCTCPDFRYRFAYYCTQEDCKFGKQENRPPKYKQTNMDNSKGLLCKHLLSVLIGKRWVTSAAKAWLDYMKANTSLTEDLLWDMDEKRAKAAARKERENNKNLSNKDNKDEEENSPELKSDGKEIKPEDGETDGEE